MQLIKSFILVIIILLTFIGMVDNNAHSSAKSQHPISKIEVINSKLELNRNKGIMYHQGNPFTGYSVKYHPNGQLVEKIEYAHGKRNGIRQKWYPNGQLSYEATFVDNKLNGTSKSWWHKGFLRSVANYNHGVADGVQKQWYKNGMMFKKIQLSKGKEEGLQQAWRENGKLYINYEAKNGRIFGLKRSTLCYELEAEKIQFK